MIKKIEELAIVDVGGKPYPIKVHEQSKGFWIAEGLYEGEVSAGDGTELRERPCGLEGDGGDERSSITLEARAAWRCCSRARDKPMRGICPTGRRLPRDGFLPSLR